MRSPSSRQRNLSRIVQDNRRILVAFVLLFLLVFLVFILSTVVAVSGADLVPFHLHSELAANYGRDPIAYLIPPPRLDIMEEAFEDNDLPDSVQGVATLQIILQTPAPTVTPGVGEIRTSTPQGVPTSIPRSPTPVGGSITPTGTLLASATPAATITMTWTPQISWTPTLFVPPTGTPTIQPTSPVVQVSPTPTRRSTPLPTNPAPTNPPATNPPPTNPPPTDPPPTDQPPTATPRPTSPPPTNPPPTNPPPTDPPPPTPEPYPYP